MSGYREIELDEDYSSISFDAESGALWSMVGKSVSVDLNDVIRKVVGNGRVAEVDLIFDGSAHFEEIDPILLKDATKLFITGGDEETHFGSILGFQF